MVTEIVADIHRDVKSCTERRTGEQSSETKKLGHPDLLYWVLWHRIKCLYVHYICRQLTCGRQICIVGAFDRGGTTAWNLTYFSGSQGSQWTKHFRDNQGGTNRNRCTQWLVVLYAQTHYSAPWSDTKTRSPWPTLLGS